MLNSVKNRFQNLSRSTLYTGVAAVGLTVLGLATTPTVSAVSVFSIAAIASVEALIGLGLVKGGQVAIEAAKEATDGEYLPEAEVEEVPAPLWRKVLNKVPVVGKYVEAEPTALETDDEEFEASVEEADREVDLDNELEGLLHDQDDGYHNSVTQPSLFNRLTGGRFGRGEEEVGYDIPEYAAPAGRNVGGYNLRKKAADPKSKSDRVLRSTKKPK